MKYFEKKVLERYNELCGEELEALPSRQIRAVVGVLGEEAALARRAIEGTLDIVAALQERVLQLEKQSKDPESHSG